MEQSNYVQRNTLNQVRLIAQGIKTWDKVIEKYSEKNQFIQRHNSQMGIHDPYGLSFQLLFDLKIATHYRGYPNKVSQCFNLYYDLNQPLSPEKDEEFKILNSLCRQLTKHQFLFYKMSLVKWLDKKVRKQFKGTCYAHASADVILSALKKLASQTNQTIEEDWTFIYQMILFKFKFIEGVYISKVLDYVLNSAQFKKYDLTYSNLNKKYAQLYVESGNPLIAVIEGQQKYLQQFERLIKDKDTVSYLYYDPKAKDRDTNFSHAVVIAGADFRMQRYFIKNSWGKSHGANGYAKFSYDFNFRQIYYIHSKSECIPQQHLQKSLDLTLMQSWVDPTLIIANYQQQE